MAFGGKLVENYPPGEFTPLLPAPSTTQNRRSEAKEIRVHSIIMAAAMVAGQTLALLGLWLRLRSRVRQEHAHRQLLVDVVRALPPGGQLHEQRADGACLTLAVTLGPAEQGRNSGG